MTNGRLPGVLSTSAPPASVPDQAWVISDFGRAFPLMEVTVQSLAAFSTRPVLLWGINELPLWAERVYRNLHGRKILRWTGGSEPSAMLSALLDAMLAAKDLIFLDAGTVANKTIDGLWAASSEVEQVPLMPVHPNGWAAINQVAVKRYGSPPITIPWASRSVIVFNSECRRFFEEVLILMKGRPGVSGEEVALNVVRAQRGASQVLDCASHLFHGHNVTEAASLLQKALADAQDADLDVVAAS